MTTLAVRDANDELIKGSEMKEFHASSGVLWINVASWGKCGERLRISCVASSRLQIPGTGLPVWPLKGDVNPSGIERSRIIRQLCVPHVAQIRNCW